MKSIIFSMCTAILFSGCSKHSEINGEYTLDTQFMVEKAVSVSESMMPADFDVQAMEKHYTESLEKQNFKVVIKYPLFETSLIEGEKSEPKTGLLKIQKIDKNQYIIIDESGKEADQTAYYNKSEKSLLIADELKLIRR